MNKIDVKFCEVDEQGDYVLDFSMPGATKVVKRWFKNEDSALAAAAYAAAQQGVVQPAKLLDWLEARGFPRREPFSPHIEIIKK